MHYHLVGKVASIHVNGDGEVTGGVFLPYTESPTGAFDNGRSLWFRSDRYISLSTGLMGRFEVTEERR